MPLQLVLDLFPPVSRAERDGLPGRVAERGDVAPPAAYVVFDCETTGTNSAEDEIVSLALIRLDPDGVETNRFTTLVRPSRPIPAEATAVHGIADEDVAGALPFVGAGGAAPPASSTAPSSSRTTRASTSGCSGAPSRGRGSPTSRPPSPARSRRSASSTRSPTTTACSRSATGVGSSSTMRTRR